MRTESAIVKINIEGLPWPAVVDYVIQEGEPSVVAIWIAGEKLTSHLIKQAVEKSVINQIKLQKGS